LILDFIIEDATDNFDVALSEYDKVRKNINIFLVIIIVYSTGLAIAIGNSLSRPITHLRDMANEIGKGNLDVEIKLKTHDELAELAADFNKMTHGLKKSKKEIEEKNLELLKDFEKLKSLDLLKDQFLSNVSHELKTPLTCIKSYCNLILDGIQGTVKPEQKKSLKIINESADSLLVIVNQLLDLSRYETNRAKLNPEECDIEKLLRDTIKEFDALVTKINGRIKIKATPGVHKAHNCLVDIDKIREVFRNIISNSIKYKSERDLNIDISLSVVNLEKKFLMLSFKDNGLGISKENLKHIFDRFFQVDESMSKKVGGTGLGLSITRHIIKMHKGKIEVRSELGKGTEIVVHLPIYKSKSKA
ncbi:HAMP domain-containing histidine kinase, partial [Candidatus Woesearchaeota archaeon]|nr:HAMP domain-containing histidine kinase [Candidatus Woesearchaeota archaeon]